MSEIDEVKEPVIEVDESLTNKELVERFAKIHNMTIEAATELIGGESNEETLKKIQDFTVDKINSSTVKLNRAQRRAFKKKYGHTPPVVNATLQEQQEVINDTARKLTYIDLIQKLRALNAKKEKENEENGEIANETD